MAGIGMGAGIDTGMGLGGLGQGLGQGLGMFGNLLGLVGIGQSAATERTIANKLLNTLNKKPGTLGMPAPYQQLSNQVSNLYSQMGQGERERIQREFGNSLSSALGKLQDRGLSSSNLTANLTAGNERQKQEALDQLQSQITGMQAGAQQSIGMGGLGTSAQQVMQQAGIKGNILAMLARHPGQSYGLSPSVSGNSGGNGMGGMFGGLGQIAGGLGSLGMFG